MKVQQVQTNFVPRIWPEVEQYFVAALQHSGGEYNADQLKVYLATGQQIMLVADDEGKIKGAASVQLIRYPNDLVCFITAIGGRLITSQDMFQQLTDWAKGQGCTKIQGAARESIERLWRQRFNFSERYRIVEKSI